MAREWEAANSRPYLFGGAGMGATRAAWQVAFRAECAARAGKHYAQSLLDLVKAFDKVPHHHVVEAARRHGLNLWVVRMSILTYRMTRFLGIDGVFSRGVLATRSLTAGSSFATAELRAILITVGDAALARAPEVTLSFFVDDITIEYEHGDELAVLTVIAESTDWFVGALQDTLHMEVSATKSVAVAGRCRLARSIVAASRTNKLVAKRAVKLLGVPSGGGRKRSVLALTKRTRAISASGPRVSLPSGGWAERRGYGPRCGHSDADVRGRLGRDERFAAC